jgi:hypothetical protein
MFSISSTEFEKKCKTAVPEIEQKVKDKAPNVKSVKQFFQLEDAIRLNLCVEYKKDDEDKVLTLRVPAQQIMDDKIDPVVNAIVNAVS